MRSQIGLELTILGDTDDEDLSRKLMLFVSLYNDEAFNITLLKVP
jgi:hypothetical protein